MSFFVLVVLRYNFFSRADDHKIVYNVSRDFTAGILNRWRQGKVYLKSLMAPIIKLGLQYITSLCSQTSADGVSSNLVEITKLHNIISIIFCFSNVLVRLE